MATNTETGESWETSYPNTVRVLIDSELNMGVTGAPRDEVVRVEVPFVSGPLDREGGTEN